MGCLNFRVNLETTFFRQRFNFVETTFFSMSKIQTFSVILNIFCLYLGVVRGRWSVAGNAEWDDDAGVMACVSICHDARLIWLIQLG